MLLGKGVVPPVSVKPGLRVSTEGLAELAKGGTVGEVGVGNEASGKGFGSGVGRGKAEQAI
jgi:hypothetical protein